MPNLADAAWSRALTQPYILWTQIAALVLLAALHPELFDDTFWTLFALALPGTLIGNQLGVAVYRRTGDLGYRRILGWPGKALLIALVVAARA